MKRTLLAVAVALFAVPLFALDAPSAASRPDVVADVIRMAKAGVAEESILAFIRKSDARVDVTANDMIAMTEANVPKSVIKAVIDEADARDVRRDDRRDDRDRPRDERDRARDDRERTRVVERVVVQPSYYWDPWYYDPFWYAPRISVGFGFGFGHFGGGYYRGGFGHFRHHR